MYGMAVGLFQLPVRGLFSGLYTGSRDQYGWLGSRVVSMLDSGAESPGSNRSRDAVG